MTSTYYRDKGKDGRRARLVSNAPRVGGDAHPDTKSRKALGRIVLGALPDSALPIESVADLTNPDIQHIAIANPDHAPYGEAAREAMQHAGADTDLAAGGLRRDAAH